MDIPSELGDIEPVLYEPYTRNDPRRSARSLSRPKVFNPPMLISPQPQQVKRRGRPPGSRNKTPSARTPTRATTRTPTRANTRTPTRGILRTPTRMGSRPTSHARDPSEYFEKPQTSGSLDINWKEKCWSNGFIRYPKPSEVMLLVECSKAIQIKRIEAFKVIVDMIEDETKANTIRGYIKNLDWALDGKNVKTTDLPSIDNPRVADLGVWVSFFGTNFCITCLEINDAIGLAEKKYNQNKRNGANTRKLNKIKRDVNIRRKEFKNIILGFNLSEEALELCRRCNHIRQLLDSPD